ncbi:hypothetical protein [Actinoplanes sp. CA-252034]|uniref:hypothetical protein n=1 Tax=Actinoplanes sp. CA-252034 TaxID=3239906 RepID=UPI003D959D7E
MSDLNLASFAELLPDFPDLTPLVWAAAGAVGLFGASLLLLLPFTLVAGPVGENARHVFRDVLGVFHHLLEVLTSWRGPAGEQATSVPGRHLAAGRADAPGRMDDARHRGCAEHLRYPDTGRLPVVVALVRVSPAAPCGCTPASRRR